VGIATWTLIVLIGLLLANQLLLRSALIGNPWVFWGVQGLNGVLAVIVLLVPIPGFEHVPAMRVVIAMLFLLRIAYGWRMRAMFFQRRDFLALEEEDRRKMADRDPPA
jgi:hypothetical protein